MSHEANIPRAKHFTIVAALDSKRGIGKLNALPWHLKADLKRFRDLTVGKTVIMGRKTWESLPERYKPLPDRLNIVLSRRDYNLPEGVLRYDSLEKALRHDNAVVIGGSQVFEEAIRHRACETLYLTHVEGDFGCDAFFPLYDRFRVEPGDFSGAEGELRYRFASYSR